MNQTKILVFLLCSSVFLNACKAPQGDPGPQGLAGKAGANGPAGDKGSTGDKGPTGPIGLTGGTGRTTSSGNLPIANWSSIVVSPNEVLFRGEVTDPNLTTKAISEGIMNNYIAFYIEKDKLSSYYMDKFSGINIGSLEYQFLKIPFDDSKIYFAYISSINNRLGKSDVFIYAYFKDKNNATLNASMVKILNDSKLFLSTVVYFPTI